MDSLLNSQWEREVAGSQILNLCIVDPRGEALHYIPSASPSIRYPATLKTAIYAIIIIIIIIYGVNGDWQNIAKFSCRQYVQNGEFAKFSFRQIKLIYSKYSTLH